VRESIPARSGKGASTRVSVVAKAAGPSHLTDQASSGRLARSTPVRVRTRVNLGLGARAHLREVELTARGIERLLQPDVVIAKELRLPTFARGANEPLLAWPPPQPKLALQIAAIRPDPFLVHEAAKGTYIEERNRRMLEDNRRQIAEAEQRQREFEKQKAAEARKAQEAERAAYYAKHGWPT
jgi:hypothetical protein